jgi:hypothetical protein
MKIQAIKGSLILIILMAFIGFSGLLLALTGEQTIKLSSGFQKKQIDAALSDNPVYLSEEHINAVNRSRRIVLQYDAYSSNLGMDFGRWIKDIFESVDRPGSQIDAIWWDIGGYEDMACWPNSIYQTRIGNLPYVHKELKKWWDLDIDWIKELVSGSRKRKLEVFWNHRISETYSPDSDNPLKKAHPDWFIKSWYYQGLWNLASPEVRQYKVDFLKELLERYELDGIQLDFARHIPCLPVGHQWELRENVTEFVCMVRLMMLDMEKKLGRPLLLAARVPEKLEGCRVDGFDVERWAQLNLIDIFTMGSRSIEVDVAGYRQITAGHNVKLQPCWDDHHSSDAYRSPPLEILRGIFGNWWQQGVDGIMIFNWFVDRGKEYNGRGLVEIAREGGSPETLQLKDKTFVVERRGGYPWAEGFLGRNDTSPLPVTLANDGRPAVLMISACDNLQAYHDKINQIDLRAIIFGAKEGDEIGARINGVALTPYLQDYKWKDNQIFSPSPQLNSGFPPDLPVDPKQKLLHLEFNVQPGLSRLGQNQVEIYINNRAPYGHGSIIHNIVLEKLELHVDYK